MPRARGFVLGVLASMTLSARAEPTGYLPSLADAVRARLAEAAAAHVTAPVPPTPIAVKWRPVKLGSLDLGAPLVALTAADLDGDGRAELYAVTSREVIAIGLTPGNKLRELGRVAFTGEPAVPAPRDVVGTAVVDGAAVIAGVSAWARDLKVEWRGKALSAHHGAGGLRLCGEKLPLAAGRNHFRDGAAAVFGARCREDLLDPAGLPLKLRAELGVSNVLEVQVAHCAASGACQPAQTYQVKDAGVAFELADVDRDGIPEAIVSSASAPGDADAVRVIPLAPTSTSTSAAAAAAASLRPSYKKTFNGGVAGLAVADLDGDGAPEVIALVRLAGATRVDVWRLD
ncbi:MAG TPA: hypothetical protein VGC42_05375 [Kofleriaceae bacterium]